MDFLNATDPATLTASPQRVFKSRCYFCSSTNSCADHLPTAASTAVRTLNIAQTADSKPPTTAPTTPSRTSSICSPLRDGATSLLESSCLTSLSHPTRGAYHDRHGRGEGCGGRSSVGRAMRSAGRIALRERLAACKTTALLAD